MKIESGLIGSKLQAGAFELQRPTARIQPASQEDSNSVDAVAPVADTSAAGTAGTVGEAFRRNQCS